MADRYGNKRDDEPRPNRLYRLPKEGMCAGVLAGVADYFGFERGITRLVFVIVLLMGFPFAVTGYIVAALLLKPKPDGLYKTPKEEIFWQSVRRSPKATFSDVRYRMRQVDQSLQRMERYVTSSRFKLDRDFQDLHRQDPDQRQD